MKKILISIGVLVIIFLDFLALDDITTGKEPDYFMEYLTVLISIPMLLILGYFLFHTRPRP